MTRRTDRPNASGLPVPARLTRELESWRADGRPQQAPIPWPRDRWIRRFPEHEDLFRRLPERLHRGDVELIGDLKFSSGALDRFLASMAWGFGRVGYGQWRVAQMLGDDAIAVGAQLAEVADECRTEGPLAGYRALTALHLKKLGPAFATKFLYFVGPTEDGRALILDRLVAGWISRQADVRLNPVPWSAATYEWYLDLMGSWATEVGLMPEQVEERVFCSAVAGDPTSQWSTSE